MQHGQKLAPYAVRLPLPSLAEHLIRKAKQRLTGRGSKPFPAGHRAVNFFQQGLEEFDPEPQRYDVIWVQWAMLYLTDGEWGWELWLGPERSVL